MREHDLHFPDVADIAHLVSVCECPVLTPEVLVAGFLLVVALAVVIEDILVTLVVGCSELAQTFIVRPRETLLLVQLDHIVVVNSKFLFDCF